MIFAGMDRPRKGPRASFKKLGGTRSSHGLGLWLPDRKGVFAGTGQVQVPADGVALMCIEEVPRAFLKIAAVP